MSTARPEAAPRGHHAQKGLKGCVGPCLDKREGEVVSWYTKEEGGEPQAMKRGEGAACCLVVKVSAPQS